MKTFLFIRKPMALGLALVLTIFVGVLDYLTGRDFAVSAFYLIPICWAGWTGGRRFGIFFAVFSSIVWFIADRKSGFVYAHPLTPYWNALMLLVLYAVVALLLSAFQTAHYRLEETVQRRTAALQNEIAERKRLESAKLQAERLATVGTMAAKVAHEIRNPLGAITLNLDLIQKQLDRYAHAAQMAPADGFALLKDVRAEIQRIQRVVEDYLQLSRLRPAHRQPLSLNAFLREKLAFLDPELKEARIKLRFDFDPVLADIEADSEQLWQALLNLIHNSMDAMPEGGELLIGTRQEDRRALIRVADSGNGMNEKQLQEVFAPFYTTKSRGTGLGLTLVQQIAVEHGGHVECESIAGRGTTFTIFLSDERKNRDSREMAGARL